MHKCNDQIPCKAPQTNSAIRRIKKKGLLKTKKLISRLPLGTRGMTGMLADPPSLKFCPSSKVFPPRLTLESLLTNLSVPKLSVMSILSH